MIRVELKGMDQVQAKLAMIRREMHAKVLQPAINKVAAKALAEINRTILEEFAVKREEVKNAVSLRQSRSGQLQAVINVFGSARKRGRSLNLIHFLAAVRNLAVRGARVKQRDAKTLGAQLGFLIKRAGGLKKIEGAFISNKGRTIFKRSGKERLPIEPVQVIGFSQMFASRKISKRVISKIHADLPVEVDRALKRLMA